MLWLDFLNGCINLDLKIWIFLKNFPLPSIHHSRNLRNSIKRIALDWLTTQGWFNFKRKIYMKSFLGALHVLWYKRGRTYLLLKKKYMYIARSLYSFNWSTFDFKFLSVLEFQEVICKTRIRVNVFVLRWLKWAFLI